jgi:hypothetical protein
MLLLGMPNHNAGVARRASMTTKDLAPLLLDRLKSIPVPTSVELGLLVIETICLDVMIRLYNEELALEKARGQDTLIGIDALKNVRAAAT